MASSICITLRPSRPGPIGSVPSSIFRTNSRILSLSGSIGGICAEGLWIANSGNTVIPPSVPKRWQYWAGGVCKAQLTSTIKDCPSLNLNLSLELYHKIRMRSTFYIDFLCKSWYNNQRSKIQTISCRIVISLK